MIPFNMERATSELTDEEARRALLEAIRALSEVYAWAEERPVRYSVLVVCPCGAGFN